jgi:Ran GTPase-activating protein (RanGAP) involved in mRNA processing and transport
MSLGYKCAEFICSVLMDPEFFISYLDLRKNPLGDDGIIVLMHAIKRSNTLVFLDISSCNMTNIGAQRVLRSLKSNESL